MNNYTAEEFTTRLDECITVMDELYDSFLAFDARRELADLRFLLEDAEDRAYSLAQKEYKTDKKLKQVTKERDGLLRVVTDNHDALCRAEKAEARADAMETVASECIEQSEIDEATIQRLLDERVSKLEGYHKAVKHEDVDFDHGTCTGYTIQGLTFYVYDCIPNMISISIEEKL